MVSAESLKAQYVGAGAVAPARQAASGLRAHQVPPPPRPMTPSVQQVQRSCDQRCCMYIQKMSLSHLLYNGIDIVLSYKISYVRPAVVVVSRDRLWPAALPPHRHPTIRGSMATPHDALHLPTSMLTSLTLSKKKKKNGHVLVSCYSDATYFWINIHGCSGTR